MASSSRFIPESDESLFPLSSISDSDDEDFFDQCQKRMEELMELLSPEKVNTLFQSCKIKFIKHDREVAAQQLFEDYFADNPTYPAEMFRRQFRMRRELFVHILNDITAHDDYFIQKADALGRMGLTSIQKMTVAIRILAYGISADLCDEYIKVAERTAIESLKWFCDAIIAVYAKRYQRVPNEEDIARLLQEGEERGFPGMLGSIDCMHWEWKNCPTAWHDTHMGRNRKPTLILEAVASKDLWIWHAFFGMAGSNNDVNVFDHSPVFKSLINGRMPPVNYVINGHQRTMGYYLSDDIYPKWATLLQTIPHPTTGKEKLFAQKQEAVRKDVERAFGVLQIRWAITQGPVRYWDKEGLNKIMRTCIILHNMIIEDEREDILQWTPPNDEPITLPQYIRDPAVLAAHISGRLKKIHNKTSNADLRRDLMENLWNQFGDEDV